MLTHLFLALSTTPRHQGGLKFFLIKLATVDTDLREVLALTLRSVIDGASHGTKSLIGVLAM
jgi:hypothetical protein